MLLREVLLFLLACIGLFLLGRYSLFNFRFILLSATRGEKIDREEWARGFGAVAFVIILIAIVTISFGPPLLILKALLFLMVFVLGVALAAESDLHLQHRDPHGYETREASRLRNEFFFWSGILVLIFILALFAL